MRHAALVSAFGRELTVRQWAAETGLNASTIHLRLRAGWHPEVALSQGDMRHHASREAWPGANTLPYEADEIAQELMRREGPFTLDQVAGFLGVSRERVRQIENEACAKFVANAAAMGLLEQIRDAFHARLEMHRERDE